ncbi:Acyl-CoA thioesterase 2 [Pseudoclavibacter triregionum]|nr:Acyl-CoA thioesterase 2 [Pseudoclavibacter triregionum]
MGRGEPSWHQGGFHAPEQLSLKELEAMPPLEAFLRTLDLTDTGARTLDDIFTGPSQWMPHGRVFGGQVVAQSIVAAMRTVPEDRPVHSMHGYFIRPGDIHSPITFSVGRLHDGNSFSTRRVQAYQGGEQIWSMISSFQEEQPGLEHEVPMPEGMPDPESLPSEASLVEEAGESLANYWVHRRPFAMRHVSGPIYTRASEDRTPWQAIWVKAVGRMPDDPILHRAAIAYVSDYTILEPILRAHGISWIDSRLRVASLDHGVHWHRFARADEWLLYVQESPVALGGRGLVQGRFFSREGQLVASVSQEGMVRMKPAVDPSAAPSGSMASFTGTPSTPVE